MKYALRAVGVCLLLTSAVVGQDETAVTTAREVAQHIRATGQHTSA